MKLSGFPKVYYLNLDHREDKNDYMISNFKKYGIEYIRISATKYIDEKFEYWKNKILDDHNLLEIGTKGEIGCGISHLEIIFNWLDSNDEEYIFIMEDDCDISISDMWPFTWEEIIKNLPSDWDCLQFCVDTNSFLRFYLHPLMEDNGSISAYMITRNYAEKLKKNHYQNKKFKLRTKISNCNLLEVNGFIETIILESGKTYSFPIFTTNTSFLSDHFKFGINPRHIISRKLIHDWWSNNSKKFKIEDYFHYNKYNDIFMTFDVKSKNKLLYT